MGVLNQEAPQPLSVTVSVPKSSADSVVLREAATRTRVASIRQEEDIKEIPVPLIPKLFLPFLGYQ
jgi:hypothetical protein